MRRPLFAVLLLLAMIGGCIWGDRALERSVSAVADAVEQGDLTAAEQAWGHAQNLLGTLLLHDEIDEADRLLARLQQADRLRDETEYALTRGELLKQLAHLPELDGPDGIVVLGPSHRQAARAPARVGRCQPAQSIIMIQKNVHSFVDFLYSFSHENKLILDCN